MKKNKRSKILLGLIISIGLSIIAIIISLSSTQAIFTSKSTSNMKNNYNTGILSITALSKTNKISLGNTLPISDASGIEQDPYVFTIKNNGNVDYLFDVQLLSTVVNTFDPQYIKIKIDDDEVTTLSSLTDSKIKASLILGAQQTLDISIRLWLDENTPNSQIGKTFESELVVNGIAISTSTNYEATPAATYITNLYNNANKTVYTDSKYNIEYNYATSVNLMNDRLGGITKDYNAGNIRYYGKNPSNYIYFNCSDYNNQSSTTCEKWRIIGVFDNMLKIIREDSIGNYSFDTSGVDVNYGYGINQWGPSTHSSDGSTYDGADLMKLLNPGYSNNTDKNCIATGGVTHDGQKFNCGDNTASNYENILVNNSLYWNKASGKCYDYGNYRTKECDFTTTGLKNEETKNMIAEVVWHLGANNKSSDPTNGQMNASKLYEWEHSNDSGIQCTKNDTYCSTDVVGTTTWSGKVGLMSPSDYAYAAGDDKSNNINTCLSNNPGAVASESGIVNWYYNYNTCISDDWILNTNQWTIAPSAHPDIPAEVFDVNEGGSVIAGISAYYPLGVRPVIYLQSGVSIYGGNGSESDPFVLRLK